MAANVAPPHQLVPAARADKRGPALFTTLAAIAEPYFVIVQRLQALTSKFHFLKGLEH